MSNSITDESTHLLACDFDQTLSFNDSGALLSEILGVTDFEHRVKGLAQSNLVQQGAELTYLILHDPEFRRVRAHHLEQAGKKVRLKRNIGLLYRVLTEGIASRRFAFRVISAAPQEVVCAALAGVVPPEHIYGTRLSYDASTGEVRATTHVSAGYGKVATLERARAELGVSQNCVVYVGDGSSDLHVMHHVNYTGGLTVAVSTSRSVTQIARRTVLSEDTLSILVPVLEEIAGYNAARIRAVFEAQGLEIQEWDRSRRDDIVIRERVDFARGNRDHAA